MPASFFQRLCKFPASAPLLIRRTDEAAEQTPRPGIIPVQ